MRTMMIANTLVADGNPTAKGAIGLKDAAGNPSNFITSPANSNPNGLFQLVNSLGNGSVKTFTINPNNFNFHSQLSGYTADIVPIQSIYRTSTCCMNYTFNRQLHISSRN